MAYGGAGGRAGARASGRPRLVRIGRRDALAGGLADGLGLLVAGLTVAGVLALAVGAHAAGELDRVLIAMLALLALASFEAVQPLSAVARELPATARRRPADPRADRSRARGGRPRGAGAAALARRSPSRSRT